MTKTRGLLLVGILSAVCAGASFLPTDLPKPPSPQPVVVPVPVTPAPEPVKPSPPRCPGPNCPNCPRKPWGESTQPQVCGSRDGSTHSGQTVQVDLPTDQLIRNCGGSDGAGLCVFTSIMFAARFQNVPQLKDFQAWMKKHPGGGVPRKVDKMIAQKCREQNVPVPDYVQVENGDFEVVKLALRTGRMPAITYGSAHMVNIVRLADGYGAFRDNNHVGENEIDWMTEEQAKAKAGGKRFWAVILLAPRPPMPPKNGSAVSCAAPYTPGVYTWYHFPGCNQWALHRDGKQAGTYDADRDIYGVRRGEKWGPYYRRPPVDLPTDARACLGNRTPGGVFFRYEGNARYSRNGAVVTREEVINALKVEDDSKKLSLTVIGSQADIDTVRAGVTADSAFASRVLFQGYDPVDWTINQEKFGFVHDGKPTIMLQTPDGTELAHLTSYDSSTIQQLRVKDPTYKPAGPDAITVPDVGLDSDFGAMLVSVVLVSLGLVVLSKMEKI